jgi:hypothetical protein
MQANRFRRQLVFSLCLFDEDSRPCRLPQQFANRDGENVRFSDREELRTKPILVASSTGQPTADPTLIAVQVLDWDRPLLSTNEDQLCIV